MTSTAISGDVNLHHLLKVMSARLLHCKWLSPPFLFFRSKSLCPSSRRGAHSWIFKFNCYLFCFKVLFASFTNLAGQFWLPLISVFTFNPIFYVLKHLNILTLCFVSGKSSTWRVCRSDSAVLCFCWLSCMVASLLICLRNLQLWAQFP